MTYYSNMHLGLQVQLKYAHEMIKVKDHICPQPIDNNQPLNK